MSNHIINKSFSNMVVDISSLKPDRKNARRHSQVNIEAIKNSLKMFGQQKPIVCNKENVVIAGNGTLQAAKELGWSHIAVVVFDGEKDARAFAIADNRTAELASWDLEELKLQMNELGEAGLDMQSFSFGDFSSLCDVNLTSGSNGDGTKPSTPPMVPRSMRASKWEVLSGDSRQVLKKFPDNHFNSVVCDPPYEIGICGKEWDKSGIAFDVLLWKEVFRVMKPGAFLLAFGDPRTIHRVAVACENSGFELVDMFCWIYANGFPATQDVSFMIDKKLRLTREDRIICQEYGHEKNHLNVSSIIKNKGTPISKEARELDGAYTRLRKCVSLR